MFRPFSDESDTAVAVAVAVGNEVTMVCIENTVEKETEAVEALDTVRDIVETGVLVTIVEVAFWAQTVPIRAANTRAMYPRRILGGGDVGEFESGAAIRRRSLLEDDTRESEAKRACFNKFREIEMIRGKGGLLNRAILLKELEWARTK